MPATVVYLDDLHCLCVAHAENQSGEPVRVTLHWPVQYTARRDVEELIGLEALQETTGRYACKVGPPGLGQGYWVPLPLVDGGRTQSVKVVNEPIPCPKVRKGIETRYRNGRWEKYLRSQGWVAA